MTLWLYATIDHVNNAREPARLALAHDAYRWICSRVQANYHKLSDFCVAHGEALEKLFTDNVTALVNTGVVKFTRATQARNRD